MRLLIPSLFVVAAWLLAVPAAAQDLDRGRQLAQRWCAECHAVDSTPTRFKRATPLAAIAAKDSVTTETLRAFLLLPHATMTNAPLSRTDADDLAAFIIAKKK